MANAGPSTTGPQVFIPSWDGKQVVLGRVKEGTDVVEAMERLGSRHGKTSNIITAGRGQR